MNHNSSKEENEEEDVVLKFNDYINDHDIDGLEALMSDDHIFIDSVDNSTIGKANCISAWKGFFEHFPDYNNVFNSVLRTDNLVIILGYSTCSSDTRLEGPVIWTAKFSSSDKKVMEWRVYDDTEENRRQLGLHKD